MGATRTFPSGRSRNIEHELTCEPVGRDWVGVSNNKQKTNMRTKHYVILSNCIEEGCRYGVSRAHKHTEDPSYEQIEAAVYTAIMERIHEVYDFHDEEKIPDEI